MTRRRNEAVPIMPIAGHGRRQQRLSGEVPRCPRTRLPAMPTPAQPPHHQDHPSGGKLPPPTATHLHGAPLQLLHLYHQPYPISAFPSHRLTPFGRFKMMILRVSRLVMGQMMIAPWTSALVRRLTAPQPQLLNLCHLYQRHLHHLRPSRRSSMSMCCPTPRALWS